VLGNRRAGDIEMVGELRHAVGPIRQMCKESPPRRVGQATEGVRPIGNHMVTHYGEGRRAGQAVPGASPLPGIYIRETPEKLVRDTLW
jgi:hypothetical protein